MKLALAFAIVIVIIYASYRDWRRAVKAVFFILVIDGALRKWILPQASDFLYFFKDVVLLGAYLRYYIFPKKEGIYPITNNWINLLIFIASGWCIFQAFNPHLGSPIAGLIGLRSYVFYIPLVWMIPKLFRSEKELYEFLKWHLLLLIPVGILGIVQFFSPIYSPINQYAPGTAVKIETFGFAGSINVRITGTFSYINSYQGYLSATFALLLPLLFKKQHPFWKVATFIEVFLNLLNSLMTGSRTPVIAALLLTSCFWVIRTVRQPGATFVWLARLFPFITVAASAALIGFRPVVEAFWMRLSNNSDLAERVALGIVGPFTMMRFTDLDGYGAGATHPGTAAIRNFFNLPYGTAVPVEVEAEMAKVALEIGPIGFILWYGLRIGLIVGLGLVFLQLKRPFLRDLALSACLLQMILFIGQMVFHHTFSVYYWFTSSFIFLLPWLEYVETWREQQKALGNL